MSAVVYVCQFWTPMLFGSLAALTSEHAHDFSYPTSRLVDTLEGVEM